MKKEIEITRHNVTPSDFLYYVRTMLKKKGMLDMACTVDLYTFRKGGDLNFSYHDEPGKPCKAEKSISHPYEAQTYVLNWDTTCYNEIVEFTFDTDKLGTGYYYLYNSDEPSTDTMTASGDWLAKVKKAACDGHPVIHLTPIEADAIEAAGYILTYAKQSDAVPAGRVAYRVYTRSQYDTMTAADDADDVPPEVPTVEVAPHLHISNGNTKLGHIHNMSLAPGRSCSATACATCLKDGCYACKSYGCYKNTRKAWDDNTELALHNLTAMESGLNAFFDAMTAPRFFRLHVGGDFISPEYTAMWYRIAEKHPFTHFLAFTKQWEMVRPVPFYQLPNFSLRLSDWPGTEIPADLTALYHIAWLDDDTRPTDTFPADCLECPGDCEHCGACWHLDKDTIFHKH